MTHGILLSADLLIGSQVVSAARQSGVELRIVGSLDQLPAALEEQPCELLVADLSLPQFRPDEIVRLARAAQAPPRKLLAFVPHVMGETLRDAAQAGFDQVLTRGQFHAQAGPILAAAKDD